MYLTSSYQIECKTTVCIVDARNFNLCIFNLYSTTKYPIATLAILFIHGLPRIWCINLDMMHFRINLYTKYIVSCTN